jgi:hypothetical protein
MGRRPRWNIVLCKVCKTFLPNFLSPICLARLRGIAPREKARVYFSTRPCLPLRDVAHDDVLCTFSKRSAQDRGQVVWSVRAGGMDRPSRTKSHSSGSLSSTQPGGPPCWASPLAFGLIDCPYKSFPFHSRGEAGSDVRGIFKRVSYEVLKLL